MATISTHNGSTVHQAHNRREERCVVKEPHIDPDGHHEVWRDEKIRDAYDRLFGDALERYNRSQKRQDRKISSYYTKVKNDAKQHLAYEMIIGVYGDEVDRETGYGILKEFSRGWQTRNPNLELIGAYYHADEQGKPHVHLDYVPVAHNYTRGMDTQAGLVKALREMGFEREGRVTEQMKWQKRENDCLTQLCEERGIRIEHPREKGRKHLETEVYKTTEHLKDLERNRLKSVDNVILLQEESVKLEEQCCEMRHETAKLHAKKVEKEREVAELLETEKSLKSQNTSLQGQNLNLRKSNIDLQGEASALLRQIEGFRSNLELVKSETGEAQEKRNAVMKEYGELQDKHDNLSAKVSRKTEELKKVHGVLDKFWDVICEVFELEHPSLQELIRIMEKLDLELDDMER